MARERRQTALPQIDLACQSESRIWKWKIASFFMCDSFVFKFVFKRNEEDWRRVVGSTFFIIESECREYKSRINFVHIQRRLSRNYVTIQRFNQKFSFVIELDEAKMVIDTCTVVFEYLTDKFKCQLLLIFKCRFYKKKKKCHESFLP